MAIEDGIFCRTQLLLGDDMMRRLSEIRVIIFGVGGVGSWCAESLIRTGIRHLTMVDFDQVCITNINRQLMATTSTVGQLKVEVLRQRLLTINPSATIIAIHEPFTAETCDTYDFNSYDYVIDAIDSLKDKALLIKKACDSEARLFSSMGAALKSDPTRIQVAEFWKVQGDPLARALRNHFKKNKEFPKRKFKCVFSDELLTNKGSGSSCGTKECVCSSSEHQETTAAPKKKMANGTLAHITAIFGFTLAGLVVRDIIE